MHRTRIYLGLGGTLAMGSFFLLLQLQSAAFIPTLVFIGCFIGWQLRWFIIMRPK